MVEATPSSKTPLTDILCLLEVLATPGPWEFERKKQDWDGDASYEVRAPGTLGYIMSDPRYYPCALYLPDAEFVTALRNSYPQLRKLERDRAELLAHLKAWVAGCGDEQFVGRAEVSKMIADSGDLIARLEA